MIPFVVHSNFVHKKERACNAYGITVFVYYVYANCGILGLLLDNVHGLVEDLFRYTTWIKHR